MAKQVRNTPGHRVVEEDVKQLLLGSIAALTIFFAHAAQASELRVIVEGIHSSSGSVLIGLYDTAASFNHAIERSDKEGFLNDPHRVAGAALRANPAMKAAVVFANLRPGRYALIVFHDVNGNGRLDKNFWGVPTEPYGFSNNAQGALAAPSFDAAAIDLPDGEKSVIIDLVYHQGEASGSTQP